MYSFRAAVAAAFVASLPPRTHRDIDLVCARARRPPSPSSSQTRGLPCPAPPPAPTRCAARQSPVSDPSGHHPPTDFCAIADCRLRGSRIPHTHISIRGRHTHWVVVSEWVGRSVGGGRGHGDGRPRTPRPPGRIRIGGRARTRTSTPCRVPCFRPPARSLDTAAADTRRLGRCRHCRHCRRRRPRRRYCGYRRGRRGVPLTSIRAR